MLLAAGWIAAQAGGGLLNLTFKETFERTRPEFADPILAASSWSFPSGHVMGTFILCGLGCYLAVRERDSWTASAVAVTLAISWSMVMAFSRLYLGMHFLSDVVAGLLAGVHGSRSAFSPRGHSRTYRCRQARFAFRLTSASREVGSRKPQGQVARGSRKGQDKKSSIRVPLYLPLRLGICYLCVASAFRRKASCRGS